MIIGKTTLMNCWVIGTYDKRHAVPSEILERVRFIRKRYCIGQPITYRAHFDADSLVGKKLQEIWILTSRGSVTNTICAKQLHS